MKLRKPKHIRKINTASVLNIIRESPRITKSDIAKKINISQQTINKIVKELILRKLVVEDGLRESTEEGGKRPVQLKFNENAGYIIGSMIGPKKIKIILTNYNNNIMIEKDVRNDLRANYKATISKMISIFEEMIDKAGIDKNMVLGIGIGVPGIVDEKNGIIRLLPYMPHWKDVRIAEMIEDKMGISVLVCNENRVRCYGEKMFGLAKDYSDFAVILTGYGIGGGFSIDGKCVTGENLFAGEFGHMKLSPDGPKCVCGNNGCLNALINTERINQLTKENMDLAKYKGSVLVKKFKENNFKIEAKTVFGCLYNGDELAKKIIDEISYWLGIAISIIVAVIDPELIIISGEYTAGGDYLIERVKETAEENILPSVKKSINIRYSQLGKKAGLVGVVGMVLDKLL
jgi:predicted NBD/HSP70 family sugar kinase